ncbi:unnamed protein product [Schistosoma turkestanicum]|nr:unnamed protein product [Schistosoma turkestanicum]
MKRTTCYLLLFCSIILLCSTLDQTNARRYKPMHKPLSEELIHYVNNEANTTWKAAKTARFKTVSDIRRVLGALPDPNGGQLETLCTGYTSTELPYSFDAREKWPYCPSISEIRDQSSCGSCWNIVNVNGLVKKICFRG